MIDDVKIVVGANFGDEGKGLMTDYFSHQSSGVVVRFNAGGQCSHTVVEPDGREHVFRHIGAGALAGLPTYLSEYVILNPIILAAEYSELSKLCNVPDIFVNIDCLVTTPYDMLINTLTERQRKDARHGSCGIGIYETVVRNRYNDFKICLKDIMDRSDLWNRLNDIRRYYVPLRLRELGITENALEEYAEYKKYFGSDLLAENYIDDFEDMLFIIKKVQSNNFLNDYKRLIFEGGQGLLLDVDNLKYAPHTTATSTGMKNPARILADIGVWDDRAADIEVCYITRSYLTRHGAGPLYTECSAEDIGHGIKETTNLDNSWQGPFRYGYLDVEEMVSEINKDRCLAEGNARISLAVTHMDETGDLMVVGKDRRVHKQEVIHLFSAAGVSRVYVARGKTREDVVIES